MATRGRAPNHSHMFDFLAFANSRLSSCKIKHEQKSQVTRLGNSRFFHAQIGFFHAQITIFHGTAAEVVARFFFCKPAPFMV